jgi:peptidoglycan/LPS O-acetylase OafA/YrhL
VATLPAAQAIDSAGQFAAGRSAPRPAKKEIVYFYGIRGISACYVMLFHLNYIVLEARHGAVPALYSRLTDWMRYGDFRVGAFFVISGFLLMLPAAKSPKWELPTGIKGFFTRRFERLLMPYYIALAISTVLFVAWMLVVGIAVKPLNIAIGVVTHVLMIHNLHPLTNLYINDAFWNLALEFQCYALFAFVFLPLIRRFGPWAQLAVAAAIGLVPHFLFHGFLDWTRPWFIILYAMGVTVCALLSPVHTRYKALVERAPWGTLWIVFSLATVAAIASSHIDTPYGEGWFQNLFLGTAVSCLVLYTQTGFRGSVAAIARPFIAMLENPALCRLGRFSYSIYLIHYPILRLLIGIVSRFTDSVWIQGGLGFLVFAPLTVLLAYGFHVKFERPWQQTKRSSLSPAYSAP